MEIKYMFESFYATRRSKEIGGFFSKIMVYMIAKYFAIKARRTLKYKNCKKDWLNIKKGDIVYIAKTSDENIFLKEITFHKGYIEKVMKTRKCINANLYINTNKLNGRLSSYLGMMELHPKYMCKDTMFILCNEYVVALKPEHLWYYILFFNKINIRNMSGEKITSRPINEVREVYKKAVEGFYQAYR